MHCSHCCVLSCGTACHAMLCVLSVVCMCWADQPALLFLRVAAMTQSAHWRLELEHQQALQKKMPQCRFLLRPLPTLLWDRVHVGLLLTWHDAYALWYTPFFSVLKQAFVLESCGLPYFSRSFPRPPPLLCAGVRQTNHGVRQTMVPLGFELNLDYAAAPLSRVVQPHHTCP